MFTVYVDDSGTAPDQKVAIATVVIIPAKRLLALQGEWERFEDKFGFKCLHTAEFAALNYKSEFGTWSSEKQQEAADRIVQITRKYGVKAFSVSIHKPDYDDLIPGEYKELTGKFHYTYAIRCLVDLIEQWAGRGNVLHPLEYVFDWMEEGSPERVEVETVMAQAEDKASSDGHPGRFKNYSFRCRCQMPGLQCVDAVAWSCYSAARKVFQQTPMKQLALLMFDDFLKPKLGTEEWLSAISFTREQLQRWITKEVKDGRSIENFRIWKLQNPARKSAQDVTRRAKRKARRGKESETGQEEA